MPADKDWTTAADRAELRRLHAPCGTLTAEPDGHGVALRVITYHGDRVESRRNIARLDNHITGVTEEQRRIGYSLAAAHNALPALLDALDRADAERAAFIALLRRAANLLQDVRGHVERDAARDPTGGECEEVGCARRTDNLLADLRAAGRLPMAAELPAELRGDLPPPSAVVCWKCTQRLRLRIDGKLPRHRIPRAFRNQRMRLPLCAGSETTP